MEKEQVQLNVTVDAELKTFVSDESWRNRISMSELISRMIQDYQARKEGE